MQITDHQCLRAAQRALAEHLATRPATSAEHAQRVAADRARSAQLSAEAAQLRQDVNSNAAASRHVVNIVSGVLGEAGHIEQQALSARLDAEAVGAYDDTTRELEQRVAYYQARIDARSAVRA